MLQQPVFVFEYHEQFKQELIDPSRTSHQGFDLEASPEDLLDTWGPGSFVANKGNTDNLYAISISGGLIVAKHKLGQSEAPVLHWDRVSKIGEASSPPLTFPRRRKAIIGA